jgi:polyisoprenyl-phosphate glycosyltransferase
MTELSILIPVFFGEKTIGSLVRTLHEEAGTWNISFEVVLINDGSTDGSDAGCRALVTQFPATVVYAELARNFSEHNAVMAGLNLCRGKFAVIIDDDFQNPPREILKLYHKITTTGADVVYSYYSEKKHHWFRNFGSWLNDKMANYMLQKPSSLYLSSFKIIRRGLINEIIKYRGPLPYIDGLILRSTQHIETELVEHSARAEGRSNYTLRKLIALWSNMFINFSIQPLRVALFLGVLFSLAGFFAAILFFFERLSDSHLPLGWTSLIISVLILSGVQLLVLGVIGEFLGRLYLTETNNPQYVIRDLVRGKRPERSAETHDSILERQDR